MFHIQEDVGIDVNDIATHDSFQGLSFFSYMIYVIQTVSAIVHGKVRLDLFCDNTVLNVYKALGFKENKCVSTALKKAYHLKKNEDIPDSFYGLYLDELMPRKQYLHIEHHLRKSFFQTEEFVYDHSSRTCDAWYQVIKKYLDDNTPFDLFKDNHQVNDWEYLSVQHLQKKNGNTGHAIREHLHSKKTKINLKIGELMSMVWENEINPRHKMNYSGMILCLLSKLTLVIHACGKDYESVFKCSMCNSSIGFLRFRASGEQITIFCYRLFTDTFVRHYFKCYDTENKSACENMNSEYIEKIRIVMRSDNDRIKVLSNA